MNAWMAKGGTPRPTLKRANLYPSLVYVCELLASTVCPHSRVRVHLLTQLGGAGGACGDGAPGGERQPRDGAHLLQDVAALL